VKYTSFLYFWAEFVPKHEVIALMPYAAAALVSVGIFALVHLYAGKVRRLSKHFQARFLSVGGGVAIAYVFLDLLPKLAESDFIVNQSLQGTIPFLERHAYIMALLGFLLFYLVDKAPTTLRDRRSYLLSLGSYALFNFLVGYAVVDQDNPEVQPLVLFTFAMGLHYFTNDYSLSKHHVNDYKNSGKWILILSIFLGWFSGVWVSMPTVVIALVSAFIGGGVIMNVIRHELPKDNPNNLGAFLLSAALYAALLLSIGKTSG
jgi:hypothetical protein